MTAWDAGLKGVTIFRDGCKRAGILTIKENVEDIVLLSQITRLPPTVSLK